MQQLSGFIHSFIHSLSDICWASTMSQALYYRVQKHGIYHALAFIELASRGSQTHGQPPIWLLLILLLSAIHSPHHSPQYPRFRSLRESDEHRLVKGSLSGAKCFDMHPQQDHMEWGKPGSPKAEWTTLTNRGNKCWVGKKRSPPYLILIVWRQQSESLDLA